MKPETNLIIIKEAAKNREVENLHFRKFLKQFSVAKTDDKIHSITKTVAEAIDCTSCGNCCKKLMTSPEEAAIPALSTQMQCTTSEVFIQQYLQFDPKKQAYFFRNSPCPLLKENRCTAYEIRPQACHDYPNLMKDNLIYRLPSIMEHYGICPIVYNTIEVLKRETGFKFDE